MARTVPLVERRDLTLTLPFLAETNVIQRKIEKRIPRTSGLKLCEVSVGVKDEKTVETVTKIHTTRNNALEKAVLKRAVMGFKNVG